MNLTVPDYIPESYFIIVQAVTVLAIGFSIHPIVRGILGVIGWMFALVRF